MTVKENIAELKKVPWIESVVRGTTNGGYWNSPEPAYIVTTKPGALKTNVLRRLRISQNGVVSNGPLLEKPLTIELPSYQIAMVEYLGNCQIRLAVETKLEKGYAIPFPTHEDERIYRWDQWVDVCPGTYARYYDYEEDYVKKAAVIAELLQFGLSHHTMQRSRAAFAYYLGLLPEEYIVRYKPKDEHNGDDNNETEDDEEDYDEDED